MNSREGTNQMQTKKNAINHTDVKRRMKERERVRWLLKQENTRTFWQEITCSGVRVTIDSIVHYSHSHKATCINQFTFNCFVSGVLSGRVVRKSFAKIQQILSWFKSFRWRKKVLAPLHNPKTEKITQESNTTHSHNSHNGFDQKRIARGER